MGKCRGEQDARQRQYQSLRILRWAKIGYFLFLGQHITHLLHSVWGNMSETLNLQTTPTGTTLYPASKEKKKPHQFFREKVMYSCAIKN